MYSLACGLLKHFALTAAFFFARFLFEVQHQCVNRLVDSIKTAGTGNKQGTISKSIWVNYITSQICQSVGSQTLDRSKNLEKTCELERCWNCWNCPGHILSVTIPRPTKDMNVFNSFSRKWWQVVCISPSGFCKKNQAKRLMDNIPLLPRVSCSTVSQLMWICINQRRVSTTMDRHFPPSVRFHRPYINPSWNT